MERAWTVTVETQSRYKIMTECVRRYGVGFARKEEMVSGHLNDPDYFGVVVIVGEGGVDGYPNVDELGDFCYWERG